MEGSCQLQGNKWTMNYPWKRSPLDLPVNYGQVWKKLESMERKARKHCQLQRADPRNGNDAVHHEDVTKGTDRLEGTSSLCLPPCSFAPREKEYATENRIEQFTILLRPHPE